MKKKLLLSFTVFAFATFTYLHGQTMPETYSESKSGKLEYGFYVPRNYDKAKSYPLVMFLHGWSANQTVYLDWYNKDIQSKHPCFVFTPKTPTTWADWSGWNDNQLSEPMLAAIHVLDSLKEKYSIDSNRLYVYGISMGGEGVFDLLHKLPDKFAAAMSICGGGQAWWAGNIAKTPLWMFHGSADNVNTPDMTERVYNGLIEIGAKKMRYTNYPGYGHEIWDVAQNEPDFYDWMFTYSRIDNSQTNDIELDMSDTKLWTIDVVHLGSKQIDISFDPKDYAVVMRPTWSKNDLNSTDVAARNIENGRLHLYQHIRMSDCTQSEVSFEINIPQEYIDEGKMEFVFSLQAGTTGDYLFNGHTYKMSDFTGSGGSYKKMVVVPADYNEPSVKQRKIERVNIIFERRGSVVSAPLKIRNLKIKLNEDKIVPEAPDVKVTNPHSFYQFSYNTQEAIKALEVRVSAESMDITRQLNKAGDGVAFIPLWGEGQIPPGHTGDVTICQTLSAPHNFEPFKIEYVFNIPKAYFDEGKMQITPFVQAGEQGLYVWSGVSRCLSQFADEPGQDVVLTLSSEDFLVNRQKKKNLIETVGFKFDRHGSTLTDPIILKSITVKLD
jgi:predicted esterase